MEKNINPILRYRTLYLSCKSLMISYKIIGKLIDLDNNNLLNNIDTYSGSGIGVLISGLLAIGYKPVQMKDMFIKIFSSNHFMVDDEEQDRRLINMIKIFLSNFSGSLIDLYMTTGNSLIVPLFDTHTDDLVLFNYRDHPDLLVSDLIRWSLDNPYNNNRGRYTYPGIVDRFPTSYLDSEKILSIVVVHDTMTLQKVKERNNNIDAILLDDEETFSLDHNTIKKFIDEGSHAKLYDIRSSIKAYRYPKWNFKQV